MANNRYERLVIIIPAYNPDEKLLITLDNIYDAGFSRVVIVDDGSKKECLPIFEKVIDKLSKNQPGGVLLRHSINLGQGRAYKTAFNYYLEHYPDSIGVIQCDADGQHHIEDVKKCADLLLKHPDTFILGVRDFNAKGIPFRSRFGNKCTSFVFRFFCGLNIKDTQTGLKGIPISAIPRLMETPGERFEYATSCLLEVNKQQIPMIQFDIQTIYIDGNATSHFNPLIDSIKIYSMLLKYLFTSLSAFIIDILAFSLFISIFDSKAPQMYIIVSSYLAKLISCSYSFILNRRFVFASKIKWSKALLRYTWLCILQASISSFAVNGLFIVLRWNEVLTKIVVDSVLFFVSFKVQQKWVFHERRK